MEKKKYMECLLYNAGQQWKWLARYSFIVWVAIYWWPQINFTILNECPPYTEIFSKRRKIYSVCVEGLSYWGYVNLNFFSKESPLTGGVKSNWCWKHKNWWHEIVKVFFYKNLTCHHIKLFLLFFVAKSSYDFLPSSRQTMNYIPELCIKWI